MTGPDVILLEGVETVTLDELSRAIGDQLQAGAHIQDMRLMAGLVVTDAPEGEHRLGPGERISGVLVV